MPWVPPRVVYTHSAVVQTPSPDGKPTRVRVPVRFTGRIWTDYKRRQYHPETGRRMSAPHTNHAVLLLDTIRERKCA